VGAGNRNELWRFRRFESDMCGNKNGFGLYSRLLQVATVGTVVR
jgi:hypothetical protein